MMSTLPQPECPGIPFAERMFWILEIAMFLWTFNIHRAEEYRAETGLAFHYDDSNTGFKKGDVRIYDRCVNTSVKGRNL